MVGFLKDKQAVRSYYNGTKGHGCVAFVFSGSVWNDATADYEIFIAVHYVARHQKTVADKLN